MTWTKGLVLVAGIIFGATQAAGDCFEFRSNASSPTEIIRHVDQLQELGYEDLFVDTPLRYRDWRANTDFILVRAAADVPPKLYITPPEAGEILSQYIPLTPYGGFYYSEVQFSGAMAHANGDGWIDIVVTLDPPYANIPVTTWIYPIKRDLRVPRGGCDGNFIKAQGGYICDYGCGGTEPSDPPPPIPPVNNPCGGCGAGQCCDEGFAIICTPGVADANGMCVN